MTLSSKRIRGSTAKIALMGICLMLLAAGCSKHTEQKVADAKGKVSDAKENLADATQDLKAATQVERAEWKQSWLSYKTDIDKDVADNETSITALRAQVATIDANYRSKYNESLDAAERKNHELQDRVNNYKDEGDAKWELFKTDTKRELYELKATIKNITVTNG
jgi:flagellar biosynthesis GTPase FlhF